MNGMEMLVNAALKATGFSRDQLDEGMEKGKALIANFETRLSNVENNVTEILRLLRQQQGAQTVEHKQIQGIAHDADVDAQSN